MTPKRHGRALAAMVALTFAACAPAARHAPPSAAASANLGMVASSAPQHASAAQAPTPIPSASSIAPPSPRRERFALHPAGWAPALDGLIGDAPMSVSVAIGGRLRFSHRGDVRRPPASNEKLLLSMALLDRFGPRARISTTVAIDGRVRGGTVRGNLWLVGHGDPETGDDDVARLALAVQRAGVRRVQGSVVGDTSTFSRRRWAPGWHRIALSYVSVPTALTFEGNADANGFVFDPERRAAAELTRDLDAVGVVVDGSPRAGAVPDRTTTLARVRSAPLVEILRRQNTASINLDAEVLCKRLGRAVTGDGTTRGCGTAIERWASEHGADVVANDGSGLSYANRISTDDMVRLLSTAARRPWGRALASTVPTPGVGTLTGRLGGVRVRAKTGTLIDGVSALSGWVRTRAHGWAAFSILSTGMSKDAAVALEDDVVRYLAAHA